MKIQVVQTRISAIACAATAVAFLVIATIASAQPFGSGGFGGGFGASQQAQTYVSITEEGNTRRIISNGIPDHETGRFPNRGNPNRIAPQQHRFSVPLEPRNLRKLTSCRGASFGVALNGVPFDPFAAEFYRRDPRSGWSYEPLGPGVNLGTDDSNAHVQPGGTYHYHGLPTAYVKKLGGERKMVQIGWAADGFPIYNNIGLKDPNDLDSGFREVESGYVLKGGRRPSGPGGRYDGTFVEDWEHDPEAGDLDSANGRFGATPEFPDGIYHYYVTTEFPFIPRYWVGDPDDSFRKGPPGGGPGGRRGPPPRGGPPRNGFPPR